MASAYLSAVSTAFFSETVKNVIDAAKNAISL